MEAQGYHVEETRFPLLCDVKVLNALGLTNSLLPLFLKTSTLS